MGQDKATVDLGGETLLEHATTRLSRQVNALSINSNSDDLKSDWPIIKDLIPDFAGPLAGVLSAIDWTATLFPIHTHIVTVPIDAPFFPNDLVSELSRSRNDNICVARYCGTLHPVFALWPVSVAPILKTWLADPNNRSVKHFILSVAHTMIDFPSIDGLDPFMNINTPDDLEQAKVRIRKL